MVRIRANASVRLPSDYDVFSIEAGHQKLDNRHNVGGQDGARVGAATHGATEDANEGASAAALLVSLVAFLAGVAVGIVECLAACLGLAAGCPSELARHLLSAGIAALIGCAPMAAARVRDALHLRATLNSQRCNYRLRRLQIKAESEIPASQQIVETLTKKNSASSTTTEEPQARRSSESNSVDQLDPSLLPTIISLDLIKWAMFAMQKSQLQMMRSDAGEPESQTVPSTFRRFLLGIWRFYRPVPRSELDNDYWERRRLVVALLFLPISGTAALQLASIIYVSSPGAGTNSPAKACPASGFLMAAGQGAVWLRGGLAGLALAVCLVSSCVELVQRRIRSNRLAVRLRQAKQSLFSRVFG